MTTIIIIWGYQRANTKETFVVLPITLHGSLGYGFPNTHPHTRTHTRVPKFIGNNVANFLRIQGEMEDEGGIGTVLTHNEGADFVIDELIVW